MMALQTDESDEYIFYCYASRKKKNEKKKHLVEETLKHRDTSMTVPLPKAGIQKVIREYYTVWVKKSVMDNVSVANEQRPSVFLGIWYHLLWSHKSVRKDYFTQFHLYNNGVSGKEIVSFIHMTFDLCAQLKITTCCAWFYLPLEKEELKRPGL